MAKYKIGRHEFETREEWENTLKDLKKIESIVERVDIDDPKYVLAIYRLIREGRITFTSELGAAFFCDLSDRVAQHSQNAMTETVQKKEKQQFSTAKESLVFKVLGIVCVVFAVVCFLFYGYSEHRERKATQKLNEIQNQKDISQAVDWYIGRVRARNEETAEVQSIEQETKAQETTVSEGAEENLSTEILQEYASLSAQYPDLIGWLSVGDSQMDLPVMQTTDNEYYLDKNIDGENDINGTLFLDCRNDIKKPSTNLIVYGHNMKNGTMFGGLKKYLDEDYINGHNQIRFDTLYEKQQYEVIAVGLSEVGYQDDGANRYYDFIEADSAEDVQEFLKTIRECAVYDRTQGVTESDHFLTLSTCNSYVEDGRLFVVAKKIQ